jgi:hypothetical protein
MTPPRSGPKPWVLLVGAVLVLAMVGSAIAGYAVWVQHFRPSTTTSRGALPSSGTGGHSPQNQPVPQLVTLPPQLTATAPAGSPSVVTPRMARDVLAAMWPVREVVLTSRDTAELPKVDTASALAADRDRTTCGCLMRSTPGAVTASQVYVARQRSFPASFLAMVQTGSVIQPNLEALAFTRASVDQPWLVAFDSQVEFSRPHPLDTGRVDSAGYVAPVGAADRAKAATLPGLLAGYFQVAKDTGRVGTAPGFADGPWTNELAQRSAANQNGHRLATGLVDQARYFPQPGNALYFASLTRFTLACGVMHRTSVYTYPGGRVRQDPQMRNWSPTVRPGSYASATVDGIMQTCFYLPRSPAIGTQVVVRGGDVNAEASATGQP